MGGKRGGGSRTPVHGKNTAKSAQRIRQIHAVCEGVVHGFANGNEHPLKSIYLDDTPVQNADGSYNFHGIEVLFQNGSPDQSYVPGFDATERVVSVGTEVKHNQPLTRTVNDTLVDTLRVTVSVYTNTRTDPNTGDTSAASTSLAVSVIKDGRVAASKPVDFTEKSGSYYYQDVVFDKLPAAPFEVKVERRTPDSPNTNVVNNTYFASYVEIITAKLSYPNTATLYLKADSEQFGNKAPTVNALLDAQVIDVPSNYDPVARTYIGMWDGSFKEAWTNNPAWIMYDLLTKKRYSGIAHRIDPTMIDRWALYNIGKYCDEMVDDGYGGREPRFVCNAYITDERAAGEVLSDLASCFRGMAFWAGQAVTAKLDRNEDPVAMYTNANVVDGLFSYATVSRKAIHTAVHVRYQDKRNGYRMTTEYLQDDDAVRKWGLNVKSMTAFGCDSRGQAIRIGKWLLHTEIHQRETVTFKTGREGLRHLPHDIIQVMDNERAGARFAGRVASVTGSAVRLTEPLTEDGGSVVGGKFRYTTTDGGLVEVEIMSQPEPDLVVVNRTLTDVAEDSVWMIVAKVKPVLYRCLSISENRAEGTYSVSALLHNPDKEAIVDKGAIFEPDLRSLHTLQPQIDQFDLTYESGEAVLTWDAALAAGDVLFYNLELYRDGEATPFRTQYGLRDPSFKLSDLGPGTYVVKLYAINARGQKSIPKTKTFTVDYTVRNVGATPKLFAVQLDWSVPTTTLRPAVTEIRYAKSADFNAAQPLVDLPHPQTTFTLTGVKLDERYWFWLRTTDGSGVSGEWSAAVQGVCDTDPSPIVGLIQGQITENAFTRELIDTWNGRIAAGVAGEAAARAQAVAAAEQKAARELLAKAQELGNKIQTLENIDANQALQLTTITAAQRAAAAALEQEKQARIAGDQAEATARQALAAQHGQTAALVTALQQTVANNRQSSATQIEQMRAALNDPDNLCRNPSMRENTAGWLRMQREQIDGQWVGLARQRDQFSDFWVPVNPGDVVYCAMWVKNKGDTNAIGIGIHAQAQSGGDSWIIHQRASTTVEGWQKVENFITAPANAVRMRLFVQVPKPHNVTSSGWHVRDIEWRKVNALSPVTADIGSLRQTLADQQQAVAQQATTLRAEIAQAKEEMKVGRQGFLDLRNLDPDTYYPCVADAISSTVRTRFQVSVAWGDGHPIPWSTHSTKGIAFLLDWESNGESWGAAPNRRVIHEFLHRFCQNNQSPVLGPLQFYKSSREMVYLRGGARYRYATSSNRVGMTLFPGRFSGAHGEGASPKQYDAGQVPTVALTRIGAEITETRQAIATVEGKVQSMYGLKVEAVGNRKAVAGLTLGADGQTGESQLLLAANKVAFIDPQSRQVVAPVVTTIQNGQAKMGINGDLLVDGTILGRHIKAHEVIDSPVIRAGSLQMGSFTMQPDGSFNSRSKEANQAGISMTNTALIMRDGAGRIRFYLGKTGG